MFKFSFALPASALLLAMLGTAYAELPQVTDARIIQPPPGAKVAAAYFTLTNTHNQPLIIRGVSSEDVPHTSLHLSSVVDDVARMEEQKSITIDAGESLAFTHGSYHVMLMGLTEPLTAGSNLALVLDTSEGSLSINLPIITPDEADTMDAQSADSMTHHNMKQEGMSHDGMDHDDEDAKKKMDHK